MNHHLNSLLGLKRSGHNVIILEQVREIAEVGAGIQLAPNNMRILGRFGVLPELMKHTNLLERNSLRRWKDNEELGTAPLMPLVSSSYTSQTETDLLTSTGRREISRSPRCHTKEEKEGPFSPFVSTLCRQNPPRFSHPFSMPKIFGASQGPQKRLTKVPPGVATRGPPLTTFQNRPAGNF